MCEKNHKTTTLSKKDNASVQIIIPTKIANYYDIKD